MATFSELKTINPTAVPAGTDLLPIETGGGAATAYTLDEIAAYITGVTTPTWQTDASYGCYLEISAMGATTQQPEGVVFFDHIVWDSGFYASAGAVIIPAGVTKVQVVCQLHTEDPNPTVSVLKNSDTTSPIARVQGSGNYTMITSPEIEVVAGDLIQIHCTDVTNIYVDHSFYNVRTIEKLS